MYLHSNLYHKDMYNALCKPFYWPETILKCSGKEDKSNKEKYSFLPVFSQIEPGFETWKWYFQFFAIYKVFVSLSSLNLSKRSMEVDGERVRENFVYAEWVWEKLCQRYKLHKAIKCGNSYGEFQIVLRWLAFCLYVGARARSATVFTYGWTFRYKSSFQVAFPHSCYELT